MVGKSTRQINSKVSIETKDDKEGSRRPSSYNLQLQMPSCRRRGCRVVGGSASNRAIIVGCEMTALHHAVRPSKYVDSPLHLRGFDSFSILAPAFQLVYTTPHLTAVKTPQLPDFRRSLPCEPRYYYIHCHTENLLISPPRLRSPVPLSSVAPSSTRVHHQQTSRGCYDGGERHFVEGLYDCMRGEVQAIGTPIYIDDATLDNGAGDRKRGGEEGGVQVSQCIVCSSIVFRCASS